jgi:hypothetical protein
MKKTIVYVIACVMIASSVNAMPGSAVVEKFKETFPNAKNVKWRDDKAGYFVSFTQNENFNKVFYNTEGDFVYALKYCSADELPNNIAMALNKKFGESKILGVTEVTTAGKMFYGINLSKENKLHVLNVTADGSITKEEVYDDATSIK